MAFLSQAGEADLLFGENCMILKNSSLGKLPLNDRIYKRKKSPAVRTYSGFKSSKSIDFVFRFPPCSYSRMIPENKSHNNF
jgi:hypothetical protein